MPRCCHLAALLCLCALHLGAAPAPEEGFVHPVMRIPKLAEAPTIDGQIGTEEWARAGVFTGVTAEGSVGGHGSLVPTAQQVQWYLAYDQEFLYLAMRSPHPKGTYPVARTKENDLAAGYIPILFEDHVEVQILTHGRRDQASTQGKGFYKIMANPKGAYIDQFLFNGTVGTEEEWSTGGPIECHVTPEMWELEMAVEWERMGVKKPDGRSVVIQLVRTDSCTGMYFAGWVGAAWMSWSRFAEVYMEPDVPACRFLELGEIGAGELAAKVELVGGAKPCEASVDILVEDADGKVVHKDSRTVQLGAGAIETLTFAKTGLPITKVDVADRGRRNHFEIKATAKVGRQNLVLYHNRSPFMQFDEEFKTQFLDKWIAGRPQSGEWEYKIAYLPYHDKLEASVDLDFFGMPEKVLQARTYAVAVLDEAKAKTLAPPVSGQITNLVGEPLLMDVPKLADGTYVARFELRDADGQVIDTKEAEFVRKVYPWEHNQLGLSDEVIPPFLPLQVKSGNSTPLRFSGHYTGRQYRDSVFMWGRIYEIAKNGLLEQIETAPPSGTFGGAEHLLAAPMRFEVTQGGQVHTDEGDGYTYGEQAMHRVDVNGRQQAGPVQAEVSAFVEYDGWYEVTAKLSGAGPVDAVDLVIDLDDHPGCPMDTLYVQRLGDGVRGNHFGAIPTKPGVHFRSTELMEPRTGFDWKSFVPRTYVGNGDRGLWFFAWSATGWELADEQPVIQVERLENQDVRLRVRLLAGPVDLTAPRTLRFALQAAPVKPNHPRYRTFNEEGIDAHDTRGYRYFGKSVDGFVTKGPEDVEALRKFILYGMRDQGEEQRQAKKNYGWWRYWRPVGHGAKMLMYGSGQLMGMGAEEFRTFGGEWLGKSNWRPNRGAASDRGRWNYQGTEQWDSDEELSVTGVIWTQSMIDFFVWYHKPLLEKAGIHGTWWDNVSISTERVYNPELGRMEEIWVLYPRRQLIKRLNTLGWQLARPPMWASNMHVDLGFAQVFWMVENDWYADGADMTTLDQWSLGTFRSMCRTKSTMQVARPWLSHFHGTTPESDRRVSRSLLAMMLSHDLHPRTLTHYKTQGEEHLPLRRMLTELRGLVNLPDTKNCLFAGYWRTEAMVRPGAPEVAASVYTNSNLRTAAILLFNTSKKDQYLAGTGFDVNRLIPIRHTTLQVERIYDLETGKDLQWVFEDGMFVIKDPLLTAGHGFRFIGVVAK